MIDIEKGRYWDEGIELVSGCSPCSPGCEHCWSAAQAHRFYREGEPGHESGIFTDDRGRFNGDIMTHPERLKRFNTRKPKVFAIWNDLFHEAVPWEFQYKSYESMWMYHWNHYLVLTKRPAKMLSATKEISFHLERNRMSMPKNTWHGLTICSQQEADEKIPVFLKVPGRLFLSIEPMLGPINLDETCGSSWCWRDGAIQSVILGGETGPGARPMNPDWVRSVRDQCAAAGVPFFFKSWGAYGLNWMNDDNGKIEGSEWMDKGIKKPGRLLDGRTHDELPWCADSPTR